MQFLGGRESSSLHRCQFPPQGSDVLLRVTFPCDTIKVIEEDLQSFIPGREQVQMPSGETTAFFNYIPKNCSVSCRMTESWCWMQLVAQAPLSYSRLHFGW